MISKAQKIQRYGKFLPKSTYNIYNMLNTTSKLKMPLKTVSPHYLLSNTDTQQIQNNLTAIRYKIMTWQPNQNHLNWDQTCPTETKFREDVRVYTVSIRFASLHSWSLEILKHRFDVTASPEEFMKTITGMNVLN